MSAVPELSGVRLGDVYRDKDDALWEVVGLCDQPQATVRKAGPANVVMPTEHHVIGCLNWTSKWQAGPLREQEPAR